jgi:mitochondrial distribution and morphology protein 12
MSVDLDWLQLSTLSTRLVDSLNQQLKSTERPSFIGPITINSFDFGSTPPDVELVDVRDIYRDFLEDDEEEAGSNDSSSVSPGVNEDEDEE